MLSSVVAAGPGAAEAAIMRKAEDPNAVKQPSVGVSIQKDDEEPINNQIMSK